MYLEFYGLTEKPFHVTSDPSFLFPSKSHREALNHLRYGIRERLGFISISGEVGTGKTTLAKQLVAELKDETRTALILHPGLSPTQLLRHLLIDFGAQVTGPVTRGHLLRMVEVFLLEQAAQKRTAVLILDEAQAFPLSSLEQLRLLSNIETAKEKLLQIVLIGQPELEERLSDHRLRNLSQRIAVRCIIDPLEADEVGPYIAHRLKLAGLQTPSIFTQSAIRRIAERSSGLPRKINTLCDQALLAGYVREARQIDEAIIEEALNLVQPEPVGVV